MHLRTLREVVNKDLRLERLRKELAEVDAAIAARDKDEFFKMPAETQKVYVETAKRSASAAVNALEAERNEASVRLGITDPQGEWTEKFKKTVEINIGATQEEMEAGYSGIRGGYRFYAVLEKLEHDLVEKDFAVFAAIERVQKARRAEYAAEEKMRSIESGMKELDNRRSKLQGDIDHILYVRMEKKENRVRLNIDSLLKGERQFDWWNEADERQRGLVDPKRPHVIDYTGDEQP